MKTIIEIDRDGKIMVETVNVGGGDAVDRPAGRKKTLGVIDGGADAL